MGNFFIKTIKLWGAIICFAASIGLFYLLSDFFSNGGGFIRVKGLIAPIVFAFLGLSLLWSFVKTGFKQGNRYNAVIAILLVAIIGGCFWYFTSTGYQNQRIYNNIVNGNKSDEEALSDIEQLLTARDPDATKLAVECLIHLHNNGVKEASFKLGEMYFSDDYGIQNYTYAFTYLDGAREKYEIAEAQEGDQMFGNHELSKIYEYLGDIYSNGLNGEVNADKAIDYYRLSIKNPLNFNSSAIEKKINTLSNNPDESLSEK